MDTIFEFDSISKSYNKKNVLKNCSFELYKNDFVGLIGNNGSGKTTVAKILLNLIPTDSGVLKVFDKKVVGTYVGYRSKIGIVLADPFYIEDFTPIQYLKFVCSCQSVSKDEIDKRVTDICNLFDIQDRQKRIKQLSAGNQKKVSIAASLIHNPDVLIMDEPFTNLDLKTQQILTDLLLKFQPSKTLLITSHNLDLLLGICSRFLMLDEGNIKLDIRKNDQDSIDLMKDTIKAAVKKSALFSSLDWLK
jgi:ABC-type multidrug transport system ATPase subunit